ncbi:hypothetical protein EDD85DRAFT_861991 [Armillaria nabsnona]|nr:hypothetical protein EDD85DRAFT_861991 [Armillaria nabsnona]
MMSYIPPGKVPDDAPTLRAHEYERWLLLTLLGKPRHDDRKASEERKILWRLVHHDPYMEPDNWEDFIRSKKNERTQNHHASRDEPTNTIYDNTAFINLSGLTTTIPSPVVPSASVSPSTAGISTSISDVAASDSCLACRIPSLVRSATDGLALVAVYQQQRKFGKATSSNEAEFVAFDRTIRKLSSHR